MNDRLSKDPRAPRVQPPDPRLWHRVREVFDAALGRDGEELAAYLDQACGGDEDLRREVDALLAADAVADPFLEAPTRAGPPSPEVPLRIGAYEIERELGRGGMGVVYLARDTELGRRVAVKCLFRDQAGTPAFERLEREARILASLNHPNVATLYGVEKSGGNNYLILEHVAGCDLAERLAGKRLPLRETLEIAEQVAAALAAAHERGVVHRDLKPGNVRITPEGQVKVLDFGLAKPLPAADEAEAALTQTGAILGTVSYMSPEQAEGRSLDQRSDIFSFGTLLYECLTGRRPFTGSTPWRTLDAICQTPPDWSALPPDLPRPLIRLLQRCLKKDPRQRLRDAGDARLELAEVLAELSAEDVAPFSGERFAPTRKEASRKTLVWALAAAAGILLLVLGFLLGRREPSRRQTFRLAAVLRPIDLFSGGGLGVVAFSPDGRRIAYRSDGVLYLRSFDEFESVLVTDDRQLRSPFFSPDGRWIGFFSQGRSLFKVSVASGVPTLVAGGIPVGVGADWGEDGTIVFAPDWQSGLWRVPAAGGEPEELTRLDPEKREVSHRWPRVLPGGRGVLFTVKTTDILSFDDARIDVLDLETNERRTLVEGGTAPLYVPTGHLLYIRGEALHAVPLDLRTLRLAGSPTVVLEGIDVNPATGAATLGVSSDGTLAYVAHQRRPEQLCSLVRVDPRGEAKPLPGDQRYYQELSLSPDGRRLAVKVIAANNTVWVRDLERGTFHRVAGDLGNVSGPVWHPDGEHLVFVADLHLSRRLVRARADGTGELEVLLEDPGLSRAVAVVPDASAVLYEREGTDTGRDVWIVADGSAARPLLETRFNETLAALSPDGRWLAYSSNETGAYEIFVRPFPELAPKVQVSIGGGRRAVFSPDSREIFYDTPGGEIVAVGVGAGPELRVGEPRLVYPASFDRRYLGWIPEPRSETGQDFLAVDCPVPLPNPDHVRIVLGWLGELEARMDGGG